MIFGIGVDIIEVDRIERAEARHPGRFLSRMFTVGEINYCLAGDQHRSRRLAARFAAKEATLKALGIGLRAVRWTDVEVVRNSLGRPNVLLHGRLAEIAGELGIAELHLSMSHSREYAMAQVVAVK